MLRYPAIFYWAALSSLTVAEAPQALPQAVSEAQQEMVMQLHVPEDIKVSDGIEAVPKMRQSGVLICKLFAVVFFFSWVCA